MPANKLQARPKVIERSRAVEIVSVLLSAFGPMCQFDLLDRAMLMASDRFRRCKAGIDPYPKRMPPIYRVCEFGWDELVGSMILDGIIERVDGTSVVKICSPIEIATDDQERIDQIKMGEARDKAILSRSR